MIGRHKNLHTGAALAVGMLSALSAAAEGTTPAAFAEACRARAEKAKAANEAVVRGEDGWLFLTSELRHLGVGEFWGAAARTASTATREDARDPLPAIVDTAAQLKRAGVALLVVPVPPRAVVYADKLLGAQRAPAARPDAALQAFNAKLRESGVEVLDLTDAFLAARADEDKAGPVCCRTDSHWSPQGIEIASKAIAGWLRKNGVDQPAALKTKVETEEAEIAGDLWRILADSAWPKERLALRRVTTEDGFPLEESADAPVLLLADSHGLVFHAGEDMLAEGGGLFDLLSAALGHPIALMARRGSAATTARIDLARRIRAEPAFLKGKRAVVWCFAARELTEGSGWRTVPILPEEVASR
jgi:alginate O-acetyltransferase complex protein AlgJ